MLDHGENPSASEMTYIVSGGALNSTHLLMEKIQERVKQSWTGDRKAQNPNVLSW